MGITWGDHVSSEEFLATISSSQRCRKQRVLHSRYVFNIWNEKWSTVCVHFVIKEKHIYAKNKPTETKSFSDKKDAMNTLRL